MRETLIGWTAAIALVCGIIYILVFIKSWKCNQYGEITNQRVMYHAPTGCYVDIDDKWVHRDNIRVDTK